MSSPEVGEAFVRIRPDTSGFTRELERRTDPAIRRVERSMGRANREFTRFGRGTLVGTGALHELGRAAAFASLSFIGGAGLVVGIRSTIRAAEESEVAATQLANALERQGISFEQNREAINARTQALSQMAGIDDELLTQTFTMFVRQTNDVTTALERNALAADVARGRNISLQAAAQLVTRASLGLSGSLRRVGIAAREGASATELLDLLQRKFAGSAQAYGNTAAGAQERFSVALENTQELIGEALLPSLTRLLNRASDWLNNQENQKRVQDFVNDSVDKGTALAEGLADTYRGFRGIYQGIRDADPFGGQSLRDLLSFSAATGIAVDQMHALKNAVDSLVASQKRLAEGFRDIEEARQGDRFTRVFPVPRVRGATAFVGRPLTAAEQLRIALAANPDDVNALQAQRAQYQKALDFARTQVEREVGNTAQWAKDIASLSGEIEGITSHLASIAEENARKAAENRERTIDALIPNALRGQGEAPGAFATLRGQVAGRIGAILGRQFTTTADLGNLRAALGQAEAEANLRTQIAETTVENEEELLPFLRAERQAITRQLQLLKATGAAKQDILHARLAQAQIEKRIRDINQTGRETGRSIFAQAAEEFAQFGGNIGALLSPQDARGLLGGEILSRQPAAPKLPLLSGSTIVQNFFGQKEPAQALASASQAARALR